MANPIEVHVPLRLMVPGTDPNDAARLADAAGGAMGSTFQVTVPGGVGGWPNGATVSNTDAVADVIRRLLNPVVPPTYVAPTLSLSGSTPLAREIGETVAATLTPSFSQNDGGAMTSFELRRGATPIHAVYGPFPDTPFQLIADVSYQASAGYAQGPVKDDSANQPYPNGQIPAGTATSNTVTYLAQRRAFYGTVGSAPINSAGVRALANQPLSPAGGAVLTVDGIGANGVCFAVVQPRTVQITMPLAMNMNVTPAPTTVQVDGAVAGQNPTPYNVYFVPQASAPSTTTPYEARIS